MACNPQAFGKKCPESTDLIFHYDGENAALEHCKEVCLKDSRCLAVSGVFAANAGTKWCMGCRIELADDARFAYQANRPIAYQKKEIEEGGSQFVHYTIEEL